MKHKNALASPAFAPSMRKAHKPAPAAMPMGPKASKSKRMHAAGGMPDVPAPGQTITSGSWTGPDPQTPTPMPSLTPNQDLRAKLGYGAKVKAAGGASNVTSGLDRAMRDHADKCHPTGR